MKTVDNLNWKFTFGKHKDKSIKEVIESNPAYTSGLVLDGKRVWQGMKLALTGSLIQYLEWAEKENILKVQPKIWEEIKNYDFLHTTIKSYEEGDKKITTELYNECLIKFNEIKNEGFEDDDYPFDLLDTETDVEPRYDWVLRPDEDVLEFKQLPLHEAVAGKGLTMEEHKKRGSHMVPPKITD